MDGLPGSKHRVRMKTTNLPLSERKFECSGGVIAILYEGVGCPINTYRTPVCTRLGFLDKEKNEAKATNASNLRDRHLYRNGISKHFDKGSDRDKKKRCWKHRERLYLTAG